ncbi:mucin-19 [Cyclospora cayetanensis]|uniref:Mucin-19 n=1 Tax=Cyclospora cayetanensis TaxID=88456 RepID=A0A6P6RX50_9EIME|nr:mucin-19 [Cyclospora cayetanensis]
MVPNVQPSLPSSAYFRLYLRGNTSSEEAPVSLSAAGGTTGSPASLGAPAAVSATADLSSSTASFSTSAARNAPRRALTHAAPWAASLCDSGKEAGSPQRLRNERWISRQPPPFSSFFHASSSAGSGEPREAPEEGVLPLQSVLDSRSRPWFGARQVLKRNASTSSFSCVSCVGASEASEHNGAPCAGNGPPAVPSASASPHSGLTAALERLRQHSSSATPRVASALENGASIVAATAGEAGESLVHDKGTPGSRSKSTYSATSTFRYDDGKTSSEANSPEATKELFDAAVGVSCDSARRICIPKRLIDASEAANEQWRRFDSFLPTAAQARTPEGRKATATDVATPAKPYCLGPARACTAAADTAQIWRFASSNASAMAEAPASATKARPPPTAPLSGCGSCSPRAASSIGFGTSTAK